MLTTDEIEREALNILDRFPVLLKYDKSETGLLAEEGTSSTLLRLSGPGIGHLAVKGIVTERGGKKRRWILVRDGTFPDFTVVKDAPATLSGRYSNPLRAFEALDAWLTKESTEGATTSGLKGDDK